MCAVCHAILFSFSFSCCQYQFGVVVVAFNDTFFVVAAVSDFTLLGLFVIFVAKAKCFLIQPN